jgi:hypothetical protein
MPYDAINVGNHELYENQVVDYMNQPAGFIEWWGDRYLSSNTVWTASMSPLGSNYRVMRGLHTSVLTFGFLFNMPNHASKVVVKDVEQTLKESWFRKALSDETYDAIVVLAHMHCTDPLVTFILNAIRSHVSADMPVQFLTGHTHVRDFAVMDSASTSLEAGMYLKTVGFASFPTQKSLQARAAGVHTQDLFQYKYIDGSKQALREALKLETFETYDGTALSIFVERAHIEMGLEVVVGCMPFSARFYLANGLDKPDSLWRLFRDKIVPAQFLPNDVVFNGKGMWRYDLIGGDVRLDDVIAVSPFNESWHVWPNVPYDVIIQLNETMNSMQQQDAGPPFMPELPNFILASVKPLVSSGEKYNLITNAFETIMVREALAKIDSDIASITVGVLNFTTTDVWLKYVQEAFLCRGGLGVGPYVPWASSMTASEFDKIKLSFLIAAVVVVVALSSWYVRQRGIIYRRRTARNDFQIQQALREYESRYRDNDADPIDSDDEGDFI